MNRTEVEFDTLSDTDWTGTKYHALFSVVRVASTSHSLPKHAVIIWCCCLKLSRTRIYHLKRSRDAIFKTHCTYFFFGHAGIVWQSHCPGIPFALLLPKVPVSMFHFSKRCSISTKMSNLINKPFVNFCNIMDFIIRCPFADQLSDNIRYGGHRRYDTRSSSSSLERSV